MDFAEIVIRTIDAFDAPRKHYRLIEQLESAATSPAMNLAEGKGRFSKKEFVHFLYIARGSLFETVTLLVIFRRRGWIKDIEFRELKRDAAKLGKGISSLINSIKKQ